MILGLDLANKKYIVSKLSTRRRDLLMKYLDDYPNLSSGSDKRKEGGGEE